MTTITGSDVTKIRSGHHTIKRVTVNVTPNTSVATAQVDGTPSSYPVAQLSVKNTSANWVSASYPGQLFFIGTTAGANDVAIGITRDTNTSSIMYIDAKSLGDSSYGLRIREPISNNHYITLFDHYPSYALFSRIASQVLYKEYDLAFNDQTQFVKPVVNIGPWRSEYLGSGGTVDIQFSAADSFAWGTKSLATYSWSFTGPAAISYQGMTTSADDEPLVRFDTAGFYVARCTITDNGAPSQTEVGYRYIWINDSTNALSDDYVIDADTLSSEYDRTGRTVTFEVWGSNLGDVFYPTAGVHIKWEFEYDGDSITGVTENFAGYVTDVEPISDGPSQGRMRVTVKGPMPYAEDLPCAPQAMFLVSNPANWTEIIDDIANPDGAVWYILRWHAPNMLRMHDFDPLGGGIPIKKSWELTQASIAGQVQEIASIGQLANIGSHTDGTIKLKANPLYMTFSARNAVDSVYTWTEDDIQAPIAYPYNYRLRVGKTNAYAFSYDSSNGAITPYASEAPGAAQAQGTQQSDMPTIAVSASNAQTDLNRIAGHYHAEQNSPTPELNIAPAGNYDFVHPPDMEWHTLNIGTDYDPRGMGWSNVRMLPSRVRYNWRINSFTPLQFLTITMQPETFGQPGATVPVNIGGAAAYVDNGYLDDIDLFRPPNPANTTCLKWDFASASAAGDWVAFASSAQYDNPNGWWEETALFPNVCGIQNTSALSSAVDLFTIEVDFNSDVAINAVLQVRNGPTNTTVQEVADFSSGANTYTLNYTGDVSIDEIYVILRGTGASYIRITEVRIYTALAVTGTNGSSC